MEREATASSRTSAWTRLEEALATAARAAPPAPEGGRRGAVLVLFSELPDGELEVVFTRRTEDLTHHPGQISFPGGRLDPGETVEEAALREASEEIGLDPSTVEVLGTLPAFFIPPSRYWLHTVVGRWTRRHPLRPAEDEVAEILHVPVSQLRDPRRWRAVPLPQAGLTWAWQLDGDHVLWGATGIVTAVLLEMLDPDWRNGADPASFGQELHVTPWPLLEQPGRPG